MHLNKYYYLNLIIVSIHAILIYANYLAVPFLIYYEPWYICIPIITLLHSPLLGGRFCVLHRLEKEYREKAGLPPNKNIFNKVQDDILKEVYSEKEL